MADIGSRVSICIDIGNTLATVNINQAGAIVGLHGGGGGGGGGLSVAEADKLYVNVSGDQMNGPLRLYGWPTVDQDATSKAYVDSLLGTGGGGGGTVEEPARSTISFTTSSVAPGASTTGTVLLGAGYRLYSIQTNVPARVRLYTTTERRDADLTRAIGTDPLGNHGLILEFVTTPTLLSADLTPMVDGFDGKTIPDGHIAYSVTNQGSVNAPITVTLTYIQEEGPVDSTTGGNLRVVSVISTNTVLDDADGVEYIYICTAALTATLPTALGNTSVYTIKRSGPGDVTVATTSGQKIDGADMLVVGIQYQAVDLVSDGTNWVVF